jgi:hypothetical protein
MQQPVDDPYEDRNTELKNLTYKLKLRFYSPNRTFTPIPVAVRSKTWVCGSSLAGIAGSNRVRGIDICLLDVLCVVT